MEDGFGFYGAKGGRQPASTNLALKKNLIFKHESFGGLLMAIYTSKELKIGGKWDTLLGDWVGRSVGDLSFLLRNSR